MAVRIPPRKDVKKTKIVAVDGRHRGPIGKAKILTPEQFEKACDKALDRSFYGERDRLFILLSRYCGMRSQEIARLWVEDITDVEGKITSQINVSKRGAKYGKERTIEMRQEVRSALLAYIKKAEIKRGPIFFTRDGDPMTPNGVQKQIKRTYDACGYEGARSHSGRRYAITTMAQNVNTIGASLEDVRIFAGHADLTTTASYIDASPHAKKMIGFL